MFVKVSYCIEMGQMDEGGGDHYLSGPDFAILKTKVLQSALDDEHLDPESVLNAHNEKRLIILLFSKL